eukprot:8131700-Lingulodinium_polyedra.AAC.1
MPSERVAKSPIASISGWRRTVALNCRSAAIVKNNVTRMQMLGITHDFFACPSGVEQGNN